MVIKSGANTLSKPNTDVEMAGAPHLGQAKAKGRGGLLKKRSSAN